MTMAATAIRTTDPLERLPYEIWVNIFQRVASDRPEGHPTIPGCLAEMEPSNYYKVEVNRILGKLYDIVSGVIRPKVS